MDDKQHTVYQSQSHIIIIEYIITKYHIYHCQNTAGLDGLSDSFWDSVVTIMYRPKVPWQFKVLYSLDLPSFVSDIPFTLGWTTSKAPTIDVEIINAILRNFDGGGVVVYCLKKHRQGACLL